MSKREHKPLRGGNWNCLNSRDPKRVAAYVRLMCRRHRLDFLLIQEGQDYLHALRTLVPGYHLVVPHDRDVRGDEHNAILVRDGVDVDHARVKQMSKAGWFTKSGHLHAPSYATVARLAGWLRVMSVHAPVSVNWLTHRIHARPFGPARRVAAYISHQRSALKWARRGGKLRRILSRRTLLGGDWNANIHRGEVGRFTPAWIARKARMHLVVPSPKFGPGHNGLDYVVTDARVTDAEKHGTGGSDHPFVTFKVAP